MKDPLEEEKEERERFIAAVNEGLRQSEAGLVYTSEEARQILEAKFGPFDAGDETTTVESIE